MSFELFPVPALILHVKQLCESKNFRLLQHDIKTHFKMSNTMIANKRVKYMIYFMEANQLLMKKNY